MSTTTDADETPNVHFGKSVFEVRTEMSGVTHFFRFAMALDGATCYPEEMEQGGETYRIGVADVPGFVIEEVEEATNLEVVQR